MRCYLAAARLGWRLSMADLGTKYDCSECGTKFYDLGKPDAVCPKCGWNPQDDGSATDGKAAKSKS